MVGWHHRSNEHKLGQTLRDTEGLGGLECCSQWSHKESSTGQQLKNDDYSMTLCSLKAFYFDSEFPFGCCEQFFIALCSIILFLLFSAMSNLLFNLVNLLHWMLQFSALKLDFFFFCHFCMFYVSNQHFGHMYAIMITVKVFSVDFYIVSLLVQFH